jgi:hypothetical protein
MGDIRLTTELVKHLVPIGLALRGMRLAKAKVTRGADITALIWVNLSLWTMIKSGRRWSSGSRATWANRKDNERSLSWREVQLKPRGFVTEHAAFDCQTSF